MGLKVKAFAHSDEYPFWVSMAGTSECDKNYHIYREKSPVYTLEYVLSGQGTVSENDRSVIAIKGDVWLLHVHEKHEYYTNPDNCWKKIWINFGGTVADSLVEAYKLDEFYYPRTNILPLIEEMHQALASIENQKIAFDRCACIFMSICQQLYNELYEKNSSQGTIAEAMKEYIDTHSVTDISLNNMIEQMHCSKSYAIRTFKKKYNITPYNYILMRKIEFAKTLLLSSGISINEISEHLGMCDSHYFSKYFKKHTGLSPSEFRIMHNKQT